MRLIRAIDVLTLDRARTYALLTFVLGTFFVTSAFIAQRERLTAKVDFPAFYNAGLILNEYPRGALYDQELQQQLYKKIAPTIPEGKYLFFAYTPFFAFLFSPLALLPYTWAFICWIVISLGLFAAGFTLVWHSSGLPRSQKVSGFLIAISFLPFFAWCLLAGQTSAFGFFWLALAVYLDRTNRPFLSGMSLALLLYKPPLLLLLLPMLVITARWRSLAGFVVSGGSLAVASLAAIGFSGVPAYREMLARFSVLKVTGRVKTGQEIDAFSFFLSLMPSHHRIAIALFAAFAILSVVLLVRAWRQRPRDAWAISIAWTPVLNFYVLLYDATLLIVSVALTVGSLLDTQGKLPRSLRWLLVALFVTPWFETSLASIGFQPLTVVMVAFGCYITLPQARNTSDRPSSRLQDLLAQ